MRYQANPVIVNAFKITEIEDDGDGHMSITLDNGEDVTATPDMLSRIKPAVGDYWVIQSDGYIYLNPKDVFERKYSPYELTQESAA